MEDTSYLTKTRFTEFALEPQLLKGLADAGFEYCTKIQAQSLPVALAGQDVAGQAQTGTGKTAGFTLPMMHILTENAPNKRVRSIRALVLAPTRELAAQVKASVDNYGKHLPLKSAVVFGGVKINPQIRQLRDGVDILVATPGRLLDLCSQKYE